MVGIVLLSLMVSFVLARYEFRARNFMYSLFAAGMMFPITVAITPLYLLLKNLHLVNSHLGIILPQIAFWSSSSHYYYGAILKSIPTELEEAAMIDGSSRLGFFFRMVLPLSWPGVATVGILAFVASWNAYICFLCSYSMIPVNIPCLLVYQCLVRSIQLILLRFLLLRL